MDVRNDLRASPAAVWLGPVQVCIRDLAKQLLQLGECRRRLCRRAAKNTSVHETSSMMIIADWIFVYKDTIRQDDCQDLF
jgi:hypothetical protein